MRNIVDLANSLIPAYTHKDVVEFQDGNTHDIIAVISKNHAFAVKELKAFAKVIPGDTDFIKCRNLWYFLFTNVRYQLDPFGQQLIKKPNALWGTRFGDCKSFALFICGCLENMGIDYNYKYVTFSPANKDVTHVYVEAYPDGKLIYMDVPYKLFNQEKRPFYSPIIINSKQMTQIRSIGDIAPEQPLKYKKIIDFGPKNIGEISEGEFDLWLAKDRLHTEKSIVTGIGKVGKAEKYQDAIDVVNDAIASIGKVPDLEKEYDYIAYQAHLGRYSNADVVSGIGAIGAYEYRVGAMEQRAQERAAWRAAGLVVPAEIGRSKLGKWLKKTAKKTIKKATTGVKKFARFNGKILKTVAKVVTYPMRLAAKAIIEVSLPKSAPYFLYLFLSDAQSAKAPSKIKNKRRKAKDVANFIVDFVGMKRSHFMEICRNGIMKKYGKSPEKVITEQMGVGVSGIGAEGEGGSKIDIMALLNPLLGILNTILKMVGKKPASTPTKEDVPEPTDWEGMTGVIQDTITNQLSDNSSPKVVNYTDTGATTTSEDYTAQSDITKMPTSQSAYTNASQGEETDNTDTTHDTFTSNTKNATTGFCS